MVTYTIKKQLTFIVGNPWHPIRKKRGEVSDGFNIPYFHHCYFLLFQYPVV